ncbi:MAG TPA: TonB-dependent receptor [Hyphomicrobiaceae bacterium]|nr:TonB-dependent receptor [Hyphomicrobiaceae bacterium]
MHFNTPPLARPLAHVVRLHIAVVALIAQIALIALRSGALAQSQLPPLTVEAQKAKAAKAASSAPADFEPVEAPADPAATPPGESLTTPTTAQSEALLARVPGSVVVVPDTAYKNSTPAVTIKDVLDYVPGVFVQPKWGEDTRLSIRGSGLSRNFHLRGVQLFMDGIPINTADGYGDFQEIDPSAYRYVEVYKGANALRYGANSLGGAINFVTPTGRDASLFGASADIGSFGFHRLQSSSGGVKGPFDFFVTGSWQESDGFRDHSWGESTRASANLGYQLSANVETRFYFNVNDIRQRIPGSVTRSVALSSPTTAAANNVANDWQRNIESWRIANKTAIRLSETTNLEVGGFIVDRHLMHPIFQWLDYQYEDYGGFARMTDERYLGGFKNRLIVGANLHNGEIDNKQYLNNSNSGSAIKGALQSSSRDKSENTSAYIENSFFFLPSVAFVAGTQFLHATRERTDRFLSNGDQSGQTEFDVWSPKIGLLWNIDPTWQVYANVSRSAEVPSFGEGSNSKGIVFTDLKEQIATTYELGTRGRRPDYTWDLAIYRAEIKNELQCLFSAFGNCDVVNADRTVHQGIEIGFGAAILKSMLVGGPSPDKLWLNVAYTLNDFYFDGANFSGNELPGAPRHFLRSELLYKHPSGVFFGPNVEWVPQAYYVDSENTTKTAAYAIWGLKLGFDNGGPFSAYIEGRNLSDVAYIASASIIDKAGPAPPLFEPGTGRAVFAGVRYRW